MDGLALDGQMGEASERVVGLHSYSEGMACIIGPDGTRWQPRAAFRRSPGGRHARTRAHARARTTRMREAA
jgi:hypothetical protein